MNTFSIGEIAIYWSPGFGGHGRECVVVGPCITRAAFNWKTNLPDINEYYEVEQDGNLGYALPSELRKKPQRRECDKLVSWDDMPWIPAALRDTADDSRCNLFTADGMGIGSAVVDWMRARHI